MLKKTADLVEVGTPNDHYPLDYQCQLQPPQNFSVSLITIMIITHMIIDNQQFDNDYDNQQDNDYYFSR